MEGAVDTATLPSPEPSTTTGAPALVSRPGGWRNLLMISIDTLRRDHVDRYATDGVSRMPFLTQLLDEAVTLDDHVQCSNWTFPSSTCTLTGLNLVELGFVPRFGDAGSPVPPGPSLARNLASHGFVTLIETTNTYLTAASGSAQGYTHHRFAGGTTSEIVARGIASVQEHTQDERWFLHLHLFEPHMPYLPPAAYLDEAGELPSTPWDMNSTAGQNVAVALYDRLLLKNQEIVRAHMQTRYTADVRWLDDQLRDGWTTLTDAGLLDDTLVVLWTDHGEQFWERGHFAHAKTLGAEENDALLAFWATDLQPQAYAGPTHATDLVPTVLRGLALPRPEGLSGAVLGEAAPDRIRLVTTAGQRGVHQSVLRDGWKLTLDWEGALQLHDRTTDHAEQLDVYDPHHPEVEALWGALRPRVELLAPLVPEETVTWPVFD